MYIVALDGVLRNSTGGPIADGVRLYLALCAAAKVVVAADEPEAKASHWLRSHGLTEHDDVIGDDVDLAGLPLRVRQVEILQPGHPWIHTVESDPEVALSLVAKGVATCLFSGHKFVRPKDRFDRAAVKSWNDLMSEMDERQQIAAVEEYD